MNKLKKLAIPCASCFWYGNATIILIWALYSTGSHNHNPRVSPSHPYPSHASLDSYVIKTDLLHFTLIMQQCTCGTAVHGLNCTWKCSSLNALSTTDKEVSMFMVSFSFSILSLLTPCFRVLNKDLYKAFIFLSR